jgi:DNA polymerase III subunit beta
MTLIYMENSLSQSLRLRCDRQDLLAAILAADVVVPSNSTKPILTNLLFDAQKEHLVVIATDSQVGLRCVVSRVHIESSGHAVVQARQLASILRESHSASVLIYSEHKGETSQLHIELSDGDYQVPAVVGESFPAVQACPSDVSRVSVKGQRFDEMVRQTVFGMDRDRTSAVLSGIFISVGNGELVLAATDGKMLCEAVEKHDSFRLSPTGDPVQAVIPAVTINHLQRILATVSPDNVEIAFAQKLLFIRLKTSVGIEIEITSRLIEGNFPSYRNALPMNAPTSVTFQAAELASAVRRVALMTSQTARGIIIALDKDQSVFSNLNYINGSARIPVSCKYQGSPMRLGVSAQYLTDVLKVYKGEAIGIELSRGLIMREPGATYLIMPISLPN